MKSQSLLTLYAPSVSRFDHPYLFLLDVGLLERVYETMKYYEREWRIEQNRQEKQKKANKLRKQIFQTVESVFCLSRMIKRPISALIGSPLSSFWISDGRCFAKSLATDTGRGRCHQLALNELGFLTNGGDLNILNSS